MTNRTHTAAICTVQLVKGDQPVWWFRAMARALATCHPDVVLVALRQRLRGTVFEIVLRTAESTATPQDRLQLGATTMDWISAIEGAASMRRRSRRADVELLPAQIVQAHPTSPRVWPVGRSWEHCSDPARAAAWAVEAALRPVENITVWPETGNDIGYQVADYTVLAWPAFAEVVQALVQLETPLVVVKKDDRTDDELRRDPARAAAVRRAARWAGTGDLPPEPQMPAVVAAAMGFVAGAAAARNETRSGASPLTRGSLI